MLVWNLPWFLNTTRSRFPRFIGYKLVHADHSNNVKWGGVCIYFLTESLPVRVINLSYLQEALLLKLNDQNKEIMKSSLSQSKQHIIWKLFKKF